MDEVTIRTKPMKKMIAFAIRKYIRKKLGIDVVVEFTDDIQLKIDGAAHLSVSFNADISKHDMETLQNEIGL